MSQQSQSALSREEIEHIIGRVSDDVAVRLIATGADSEQLMEAYEWISGAKTPGEEDDRPLSGPVGEAYDILTTLERFPDENERRD
jgi:hypothetical protein